jgi:hypothetical protein
MRYKFYREHKFISATLNDVAESIARADFSSDADTKEVLIKFEALRAILGAHTHYEDVVLHKLLREKNSTVQAPAEADHQHYKALLATFVQDLQAILASTDSAQRIDQGDAFYLSFRKFASDNLRHLCEEEEIILPELRRLYSNKELCKVECSPYESNEQIASLMKNHFPHMNPNDREAFLTDIKACDPAKFAVAWESIQATLEPSERANLTKKLL